MARTISLVQRVEIASPCTARWEKMIGDERVRFCADCRLNVYNLSAMTEEDGEALIRANEGRLCARIYRRSDGTILTRDCPVGLAAMRRRALHCGTRIAAALAFIIGLGFVAVVEAESALRPWLREIETPSNYHAIQSTLQRWIRPPRPPVATAGMIVVRPVNPPPNAAP